MCCVDAPGESRLPAEANPDPRGVGMLMAGARNGPLCSASAAQTQKREHPSALGRRVRWSAAGLAWGSPGCPGICVLCGTKTRFGRAGWRGSQLWHPSAVEPSNPENPCCRRSA